MRFLFVFISMAAILGAIHVQPAEAKKKVVTCYLDSSSLAKVKYGGYYTLSKIDTSLCTHLIYAFASLGNDNKIKPGEPWWDLETVEGKGGGEGLGLYKKFTDLKTTNLKTLLAIGGASDSEKKYKYSELVASEDKKKAFIPDVITFLTKHNFDGLDLDWEYPGKDLKLYPNDKSNFVKFVKELRTAFDTHNNKTVNKNKQLMLTAAVMATKEHADAGYNIASLCKELDLVQLMTYDMAGSFDDGDTKIDHHAPLKKRKGKTLSVESSVDLWIGDKCATEKIVIGVPLYGRTFKLKDESKYGIGNWASGKGNAGTTTKIPGLMSYKEICTIIKDKKWKTVNGTNDIGPYAHKDYQWVCYDDAIIALKKAKYAKEKKLAGVMVWAINYADYDGSCGGVKYPLLKKMSDELKKPDEVKKP